MIYSNLRNIVRRIYTNSTPMIGFKEQRFAKFFTPIRKGAAQKKRNATATLKDLRNNELFA